MLLLVLYVLNFTVVAVLGNRMGILGSYKDINVDQEAQSVQRQATGWTVQGSNPGGGKIFHTCPGQPWGPPHRL
jgi:hypothetical protein